MAIRTATAGAGIALVEAAGPETLTFQATLPKPATVLMTRSGGLWVVVAPDSTLISTAGTTTSGLQEAINYAQTNGYSLEVIGPGVTAAGAHVNRINCTTAVSIGPAAYMNYIFKGCIIRWDNISGNVLTFNTLDNCTVDMDCVLQRSGGSAGQTMVLFNPTVDEPQFGGNHFQQSKVFIRHMLQFTSGSPRSMVTFAPAQDRAIINSRFEFGGIDGGGFVNNCIQVDNPVTGGAGLSAFNDNHISWHLLANWKDDALVIGASGVTLPLAANKWEGSIESIDATADNGIRTFGKLDTFLITSIDVNAGALTNGINFAGSEAVDNIVICPQIVATTKVVNSGARNTVYTEPMEGTFTPTANGFTVVGTPTYTGRYVKRGKMVFVIIKATSTTTIASTSGTSFFNAFPAAIAPAEAGGGGAFSDTSGVSHSSAMMLPNGNLMCPTWAAVANTYVSVTYMAAF